MTDICVVCHQPGGKPYPLASGRDIGPAHAGHCGTLRWLAHIHSGLSDEESRFIAWLWRARAADVAGVAFSEARPRLTVDVAWQKQIARLGLGYVARELEGT